MGSAPSSRKAQSVEDRQREPAKVGCFAWMKRVAPELSSGSGAAQAQRNSGEIVPRSQGVRLSANTRSAGRPAITLLPTLPIKPFPHQRPPRYLTQDEVGRFFAVIGDARDRALFTLMYHHGLRVGEVLLLRRRDLDLERGRILVRRLKGGAWSEQVLFGGTAAMLRDHVARTSAAPEGPLFPGRSGPLKRRQIQSRFVRYRSLAGLPADRTTHSLRHSIATHLLDAGMSLEFVQDHLGHQDIRSTSVYARITDRHRAAIVRRLAASRWIVQPSWPEPASVSPPPEGHSDE